MIKSDQDLSTKIRRLVNKSKYLFNTPYKHLLLNRCHLCNKHSDSHNALCKNCLEDIQASQPKCATCSITVRAHESICNDCKNTQPYFDQIFAPCSYEFPISKLCHDFKFLAKKYIAESMSIAIIENRKLSNADYPDLLCAIPMHPKKHEEHQFDQANELATRLSHKTGIRYRNNLLVKTKETKQQKRSNKAARLKNIKNSFSVRNIEFVKGNSIAIVDDVVTTGATVDEASRMLKQAGAKRIEIWAFARTPKQ
ncbi:hypothetical protein A3739_10095 [Oleiphilus sp. HI0067]|nr:hypothetical protein A3739_10095 [Oleiphilus sp. HI0067]KZY69411.1 hypothetical protein A3738_04215 [Oleiphilus sp. HI0066]